MVKGKHIISTYFYWFKQMDIIEQYFNDSSFFINQK